MLRKYFRIEKMKRWIIERKIKFEWKINLGCLILVKIDILERRKKKRNWKEEYCREIIVEYFLESKKR